MRVRRRLWIALVLACVGATLYEIPNALLIRRHAFQGRRGDSAVSGDDAGVLVSDEEIVVDPEAGDILKYCLADPSDQELGELVTRYPENEFFLAQLAERLLEAHCVDRRAALALIDELIGLSPENAHYRYLKGWALLKPPRETGREQEAVAQFELGNGLGEFYLPYSKYRQRVDRLGERTCVPLWERYKARPGETGVYFDLGAFLARSQGPYATLGPDACRDLSEAAAVMGKRLIDNGQTFGQLEHGMFLLQLTETMRLRKLDLSKEQAWEARLHLGQTLAINAMLQRWFHEAFTSGIAVMKAGIVAIVPLMLGPPLPLLWVFLVIVNLLRGRGEPTGIGLKAYVLFTVGLVSFYCLLALSAFLNKLLPGTSAAGIAFIVIPATAGGLLWLLAHLPPLDHERFRRGRRWVAVVCGSCWLLLGLAFAIGVAQINRPDDIRDWLSLTGWVLGWPALWIVLWAVVVYRQHVFRAFPYDRLLRLRIVQMALLLFVATGIIRLVWGVPFLPAILTFVTLLLAGIIAVHSADNRIIVWDALTRFFARQGQIVVTRARLAHVIAVVMLVCWSAILVGVDLSAAKWRWLETMWTDPLALYGPVPETTRENYERMIVASEPDQDEHGPWGRDAGVPERLHLAAPEDVTAFLTERQTGGKPLSDIRLRRLAYQGGRDIHPIVVKAMVDPNNLEALLMRAKWGDVSAKERLVSVFERRFTALGEPFLQIRQDPNCLQGLILKARLADEDAKKELDRLFVAKMTALFNAPLPTEDKERLRSELGDLVTIHEVLISLSEHGHVGRFMRKNRERSNLLDRLLIDADILDLEPAVDPPEIDTDRLESLLEIAEALAFVSDPAEARARFQWLMAPFLERRRQVRESRSRSRSSGSGDGHAVCLFYHAMRGLPYPESAALLKEYTTGLSLSDLLEEEESLKILATAGDRTLAEQMLQYVSESAPSAEVLEIPEHGIMLRREDFKTHREDTSHTYLEPVFGHLTVASVPALLEYLSSDNVQVRASVVWRLTSLGYDWPDEQVHALLADANWKVRLNGLFACDSDDLETAIGDENSVVRVIARILPGARKDHEMSGEAL